MLRHQSSGCPASTASVSAQTRPGGAAQVRKLAMALCGLLAAPAVVIVGAGTASAQDGGTETIRGFLRNEGAPVAGVTITVSDADGEEVETTQTDAEGFWEIPVPEPGEYEVVLDTDTLPDDVSGVVADTITTTVNALQQKAVLFRIGEAGGGEDGDSTNVPAEGTADTAS